MQEENMMKKMIFPVILMILAGLVFTAVFSCKNDTDSDNITTTYTGKDEDGKEYKLLVTGDTYALEIDDKEISTGKLSKNGNIFTLTPNSEGENFDVTVDGYFITEIKGKITPDDGSEAIIPGKILPPFTEVVGKWDWSTSDDSATNEWKGSKQSVFPPGGASRITNAIDITGTDGLPGKAPFVYPAGTVMDNDGKPITVPVYNFTGTTKVLKDNRAANEGARFPQVGWEAVPDEATLAQLRTAYGYTFWVRLNSATSDSWAFLTSVVTDFEKDEGHEYKHWFGNKSGDSGGNSKINNYTDKLAVNTWYKITVIMDQTSGFNMFQDAWIYTYDSGKDFRGPFNQDKAQKIQWQIPLQHQKTGTGEAERSGEPYDVIKGSYDFNLDFYGLELQMK